MLVVGLILQALLPKVTSTNGWKYVVLVLMQEKCSILNEAQI
jgi:hypothetical protein